MRIIAGKYRGRRLNSPLSLDTRPTSDRLRETLFNIIAARIRGARFLDLCAGSGAVGVEALSRGAVHGTFVDRSRQMRALIETNLDLCGISSEAADIITADAVDFLRRAVKRKTGAWDIAFFDPPYADNYQDVMEAFGGFAAELLGADALLIVEHFAKNELPAEVSTLTRLRILKQGESALSFYARGEPAQHS